MVRLNAFRLEKSTVSHGRLFHYTDTRSAEKCGPGGTASCNGVSEFYKVVHT